MLECAGVILHVVVVIVGIGEKVMSRRENVGRRYVRRGESVAFRMFYLIHLLRIVAQILAYLIAEIGVGVAVAYHFYRVVDLDSAVVGGEHDFVTFLGDFAE